MMVSFGALATAGRYSYLLRERVGVIYSGQVLVPGEGEGWG